MNSKRVALLGAVCVLGAATSWAQKYEVPFRAEDFDKGEVKVWWKDAKHSDSGVQEWGYDLGAKRHDSLMRAWTEYTEVGADGKQNSDFLIYKRKIYAMRAGTIIACWRNAPENKPDSQYHPKVDEGYIYGGGNGYWIEHDDGTRAEYAHMFPGSAPAGLCPHDAELMPVKIASPAVVHAWPHIRVTNGKRVEAGQFLGLVGNVGTSSHPHLHVHVEKGGTATTVKTGGEPVKVAFKRGLSAPADNGTAHPSWTSFAGKAIPAGPVLIWPPRTLVGEYARHGYPATLFQELFDHLSDSGFWPVWLDTYSVGGKSYVNEVWRPAEKEWRAHCLRDSPTHDKLSDEAKDDGFGAVYVDSSLSDGKALYTAIFVKGRPSDMILRHGLDRSQYDALRADAKQRNLNPVAVSPVWINGIPSYTVLFRPEKIGDWVIKAQLAEGAYQDEYNRQKAAGRRPIHLNGYTQLGLPFLSAVFASGRPAGKDRHGISADAYQAEYDSAIEDGMLTRAVTSFDGQSTHRFAAAWWK